MFPASKPTGMFGSTVPYGDAAQEAPDKHAGLRRAAGIFADFAAGVAGRPGPYLAMQEERRQEAQQQAQYQRQQADQYAMFVAKNQYEAAHPAPQQPSEFDQNAIAGGYVPGTPEWTTLHRNHAEEIADPVVQTPNGMMLRSQALKMMSGQPAPAGVTFTPIPDGGPTPQASGGFPR